MKFIKKLFATAIFLAISASSVAAGRVSDYTRTKLNQELPILGLNLGDSVLLRTFKEESRLELWMRPQGRYRYTLFRTYPICYYSGSLGPKQYTGDKTTPEGFYNIHVGSLNPASRFHLSMNIGYPNEYDRTHGRTGKLLMIHGACDAVGCFAMSNAQIEEIYYLVESALNNGQPNVQVHAFPFHLTDANMVLHSGSQWQDFWQQLKIGYDKFNQQKKLPIIQVNNGRYRIFSGN